MSLSNRVSLDTDVVFLRNIFMFSTNTNNVPVSTNFIMAAGQYGQIGAVDTLRNIETYGVGYLPCTFSTFNGQMLSISSNVASSFVNSNQLFSVQNYLISSISSTNADLNAFSSYVVNELVPSTVSGITFVLSSLNSSFQGYVVGTTVTQGQLFSTTDGLIVNTGNQISSYSTVDGTALASLSNFFVGTGVNNIAFSNLSTYVSTFAASTNFSLISTGQNFVALSNFVRLTTASNSTYLANVSATVSALIDEVNILSSLSQDPLAVIGFQSTLANVRFGSNITISSINSNYKFGVSTFTGPDIFMSTATFSSLSAASGFISSFAAITISSSAVLTSSVQAQQLALNREGSNYTLDVGGDINFSGTMYNNGAVYPPAPVPVNVLGTLSTSGNVWFGSNIMISSINSNYQFRESTFTGPSLFMSTATFSTLSAATGYISSFGASVISTGRVVAEQMSSMTLHTSSIVANTVAAVAMAANDGYFVNTLSSAAILTSSMQAQQIALNREGSNYTLDVGGDINFSGTMYNNGAVYPSAPVPVNVLGTLSTSGNVWFGSNIMISSINSNVFIANSTISSFNIEASTVRATRIAIGTIANPTNSNALFVYGQSYFRDILRAGSNTDIGPAQNVLTVNSFPGNVGINCNAPVYSLDVNGIANINDVFAVGPTYGETLIAQKILSDNRVGINCNAPSYTLDVGGDINFIGTMYKNGVEYPVGGGGDVNVLGTLSTGAAADTWFNSNINVSSINSNIYLSNGIGIGTQTGIGANGLTVTGLTTLSIAEIQGTATLQSTLLVYPYTDGTAKFLLITNHFNKNIGINVGFPTAGIDLDVAGTIYSRSTVVAFSSMSTAVMQVSSLQAQQATVAGTLRTSGVVTFSNTLGVASLTTLSNGVNIGGTVTASNAATVGTTLGVGGATTLSNTLGVASATTLSNTLNVIGQATFSNTTTPLRMSNVGSSNSIDFSLTGAGGPYITLLSSDATTGQNYPMIAFSNSGTAQRYRLGLGNNSGGGGWTANQLTLFARSNITEVISLAVGSNGFVGIGAAADSSNALRVGGAAFITGNFAAGSNTATTNVLFVDDVNNRVGINCNAPTVALNVNGQTAINDNLRVGTSILFVDTVDSKVGINTASFGTERFKVDGTALITSNLIAGSNAGVANLLFVNDASNSVGINCNAPNSAFALDVNGNARIVGNLSTTGIHTVQTVSSDVFAGTQVPLTAFNNFASGTCLNVYNLLNNATADVLFYTIITTLFNKYNLIDVTFTIVNTTNQVANGGGEWDTFRFDTNSVIGVPRFVAVCGEAGGWNTTTYTYKMKKGIDFNETDTALQLFIHYVNSAGNHSGALSYLNITGLF